MDHLVLAWHYSRRDSDCLLNMNYGVYENLIDCIPRFRDGYQIVELDYDPE